MLGPRPDAITDIAAPPLMNVKGLEEDVIDELDYLRTYARQHGESAAWLNAADTIVKLRRYAGEAKARLTQLEAQVARMREVLEDVDALHRSAAGQPNERGDNLTPMQVWQRVRAVLFSS